MSCSLCSGRGETVSGHECEHWKVIIIIFSTGSSPTHKSNVKTCIYARVTIFWKSKKRTPPIRAGERIYRATFRGGVRAEVNWKPWTFKDFIKTHRTAPRKRTCPGKRGRMVTLIYASLEPERAPSNQGSRGAALRTIFAHASGLQSWHVAGHLMLPDVNQRCTLLHCVTWRKLSELAAKQQRK